MYHVSLLESIVSMAWHTVTYRSILGMVAEQQMVEAGMGRVVPEEVLC